MGRATHEGAMGMDHEQDGSKMPNRHGATPQQEGSLSIPTDKMPRSDGTPPRMETPMGMPPDSKMPRSM